MTVQPTTLIMTAPNEIRARALREKLQRTLINMCGWWGIGPELAMSALDRFRGDLTSQLQSGSLKWPDPSEARYAPGTPDNELRELALMGVVAIVAQGILPSGRNVWRWCKKHGARKRQSDALRIVGSVVAVQRAGEVAAAYVRGAVTPGGDQSRHTSPSNGDGMGR